MLPRRIVGAAVACLSLAACQTDQSTATAPAIPPPDHKAAILAARSSLWKDPDSIKAASITAPRRHLNMMWHVCVRANARNSFGGYTGEKDMLIGLYDDTRPPSVLMVDATGYCDFPHEPFPEIEAGYKPPGQPRKKP